MAAVTVVTTLVVIPVGLVTTAVDLAVDLRRARTEVSPPRQPMEGTRKTGIKKTDYPHGGETKTKHCQKLN